ncbi:FecR family protein [Pedobacter sp. FW305-3-2-15-E-R2A2]|uniref:FecR family protein n=1 Tax=Pedobacter sp. FW305-3-2-15-E-R2A2 TaxID=3140251 RepID=UPI0031406CE2
MIKKYFPEDLVYKYSRKACSEEEKAIVESWHIKDLSESTYVPSKENISLVNIRMANKLEGHIYSRNKTQRTIRLWQRIAITASILLAISVISLFYLERSNPIPQASTRKSDFQDILPGGYKAILTLNDGKKIRLNEKSQQAVILQSNASIRTKAGGRLIYENIPGARGHKDLNILETPRGGQYQLTLPDGTKVWLNSSSRLTYPTAFTGKERQVKLIGEAFFEVAKDRSKPFRVHTEHQVVEVLGTHFNILAYPEEQKTQTTLLEGKIRIHNQKSSKIMRPGQEAFTEKGEDQIAVSKADIEKNIAWKNDEFIFNGEDLQSIMRSIARWYDVEVSYQNYSNHTRYWGTVSRSKNISAVLKMLESTGKIKFEIKGRRIIAMN